MRRCATTSCLCVKSGPNPAQRGVQGDHLQRHLPAHRQLQGRLAELEAVLHPSLVFPPILAQSPPKNRPKWEELKREQEGFQEAVRVLEENMAGKTA